MTVDVDSGKFKYGFMGFCRRSRKSIPWTVGNAVRCGGCSYFVPSRRWKELGA
jgi:hypothetical protein